MSAQLARLEQPEPIAPESREPVRAPASAIASDGLAPRPVLLGEGIAIKRRPVSRWDSSRGLVEPRWRLMAPAFLAAMLLNALVTLTLPRLLTIGMFLVAASIAAATPIIVRLEQKFVEQRMLRSLLALGAIGLPMVLFGLAMGRWTDHAQLDWSDSIGFLVIVTTLACTIQNRRIAGMIIANVGLWAGAAVVTPSAGAIVALAVGSAVGIFLSFRQTEVDADRARRAGERHRTQTRAEEILKDYEQTGQGWFWETDRRGTIVYVSHTVGEAVGRDSNQLAGRPFSDLFDTDGQGQENERTLAFHFTARSAFSELALRVASIDEERWWSLSGRPMYDGFG
ncbi:MAG: PAS domain-containing protein, partial [Proteobacteria bacterium]|nr:PAS domain-containing protein [Pseudomonadota bacterium]